jgi:hypothetical protein
VASSKPVPSSLPAPNDPFRFDDAPALEDDDLVLDEEERLQVRDAWRKVRTGITLILYSIGATLALGMLTFCMVVALTATFTVGSAGRGGAKSEEESAALVMVLVGGLMVLGGLTILGLRITGQAFCIAAPSKHGAKGLAIAALLLTIASLFLTFGMVGLGFIEGATGKPPLPMNRGQVTGLNSVLNVLSNGIVMIEAIVFLFFLRAVALGVHNRGLAQSIGYLMMVGGTIVVLFIGLFAVMAVTMPGGGPPAAGRRDLEGAMALVGVCGCVIGILFLTFAIWYLVTLFQVRNAISAYLRHLSAASY